MLSLLSPPHQVERFGRVCSGDTPISRCHYAVTIAVTVHHGAVHADIHEARIDPIRALSLLNPIVILLR